MRIRVTRTEKGGGASQIAIVCQVRTRGVRFWSTALVSPDSAHHARGHARARARLAPVLALGAPCISAPRDEFFQTLGESADEISLKPFAILPFMIQFDLMRRTSISGALFGAAMLIAASASPQTTPAGWKVIKDKKQLCQMAVPADWVADKIMTSQLTAPDGKTNALLGAKPEGATYAQISGMAKDMFKPAKSFDATSTRTWFEEAQGANKNKTSWYAVINTTPVCEVQVEFFDQAFEASAKKIVESLRKAQ